MNTVRMIMIGFVSVWLFSGCGKPPSQQGGGPGGDWPANAVVTTVTEQPLQDTLILVGTLLAREHVEVMSEMPGKVAEVLFEDGSAVEAADVLVRLNDTAAKARVQEAEAAYELAALTKERNKELLQNDTISQQEYDQTAAAYHHARAQLTLARDQLDKTVITAPFNGAVRQKRISAGQVITAGTLLTELIQLNPLELEFNVPEMYLSQLATGQEVSFLPDAFAESKVKGEVIFIDRAVDPRSRTITLKALVSNTKQELKPGMFGEVEVLLGEQESVLLLPESCVQMQRGQYMVVAVNQEGLTEFRPVETGRRIQGQIQILSGVEAGEKVVVEGFQKMGPGMKVVASVESEAYGVQPGPLFEPDAEKENAEQPDEAE